MCNLIPAKDFFVYNDLPDYKILSWKIFLNDQNNDLQDENKGIIFDQSHNILVQRISKESDEEEMFLFFNEEE